MAEEKSAQMKENIGKRVKMYIFYLTVLILVVIYNQELIDIVRYFIGGTKEEINIVSKLLSTIVTVTLALIAAFLNIGRDINLHNMIDNLLFHVRENTSDVIINEMIETSKKLGFSIEDKMKNNKHDVSFLFYHFINEQAVLRDLAFTKWEQYYVNLYKIIFGAIGLLTIIVYSVFNWPPGLLTVFCVILCGLVVALYSLYTFLGLVPEIYKLPIQQIRDIPTGDLTTEIQRRFGTQLL